MIDLTWDEDPIAPKLGDVARLAGVSTATVSRCLNTPDRVTEATRQKVMQVIEQTGYAPNFNARALAARRTNTIGAIIPTMDNAIFARGLQAFQEELATHGYTLLVATSSYKPDLEAEQIRTLLARGADALLLIGTHRDVATYEYLRKAKVPSLIAWTFQADGPLPSVGFDNRAAMRDLAQRVTAYGHRRLAVISAPTSLNDRAAERVSGILEAAAHAGIDPDTIPVIETPYSIENGEAAAEKLLSRADRPSVIMCGNDVLAAGALHAAGRAGLSVPDDLSVTGFDDIELARIVQPGLTTVHVPHRRMGAAAAHQIAAQLRDEFPAKGERLDTYVIERKSLGPVAS